MALPKVTPEEKADAARFWRDHLEALQNKDLLKPRVVSFVGSATQADNIGYEPGQIRPGKLGQWDLYDLLREFGCSEEECLLASGLTAGEVAAEERREELRRCGVNPDDPQDVAEFERMEAMSPEEINTEVARLEKLLEV